MLNLNQPDQKELLCRIDEVSFAVYDMLLFLNTHPSDQRALDDTRKLVEERRLLLETYARFFGPLTVDSTVDSCSDSWAWVMQPWPWELPDRKGRC